MISNYIDDLIDDFLALTIDEMKAFVNTFEADIETSIEDADIKNPSLEQNLRDLVELLKSLIPIVEGDIPESGSVELHIILVSNNTSTHRDSEPLILT